MKKLTFVIIACFSANVLLAQTSQNGKQAADEYIYSIIRQKFKNPTGNDRENWSGLGSAVLNLLGKGGAADLTVSPTLFTLTHFRGVIRKDTNFVDEAYRKQWFARNLQLNFSLTPNAKNQVHVDAGGAGFKFAILNNKSASEKDYKSLESNLSFFDQVDMLMQQYASRNPADKSAIIMFKRSPTKDNIKLLPPGFLKELKRKYPDQELVNLLLPTTDLKKALDEKLKNKPILTFTFNDSYDFRKSQQNSVNVLLELAIKTSSKATLTVNSAYSWNADTSIVTSPLIRNVFKPSIGLNYIPASWFEIKPAFDYTHINGKLYKSEHEDAFNLSVTPRLKINDQFWLPVKIAYDIKHPQFFGFLSVQYSLK